MEEFVDDKKRLELVQILYFYTAMFNSSKYAPFAYADIQKINSLFPHINDENFWNKLNSVFLENYNMDLKALEEYLTQSPMKVDTDTIIHIFELINQKK